MKKVIGVVLLLLVVLFIGFQKVPPEEMAATMDRLHKSEQRVDEASKRLQRAWDASPINPRR
jgi:hypothetical protein